LIKEPADDDAGFGPILLGLGGIRTPSMKYAEDGTDDEEDERGRVEV